MSNSVPDKKEEILHLNISITNLLQEIQSRDVTAKELSELNSKIRAQMATMKNLIAALQESLIGISDEETASSLRNEIELYQSRYTNLQTLFRKANVTAQIAISSKSKAELFYADSDQLEVRDRKSKNKDELLKMSSNTTQSLLQVSQHLASIVDQSKTTVETLVHSSQTVSDTNEEFRSMGNIIGVTKKLVSRYGRRETTDFILILVSFVFFFACCLYVLQKRVF